MKFAAAGNRIDEFSHLVADTGGDADVDNFDKQTLKSAYGKRFSDPGYLWYLDVNANGRIRAEDAVRFWVAYSRSIKVRR